MQSNCYSPLATKSAVKQHTGCITQTREQNTKFPENKFTACHAKNCFIVWQTKKQGKKIKFSKLIVQNGMWSFSSSPVLISFNEKAIKKIETVKFNFHPKLDDSAIYYI